MLTFQPFQQIYQALRNSNTKLCQALDIIGFNLSQVFKAINDNETLIAGLYKGPTTTTITSNAVATVYTNTGVTPRYVFISLTTSTGALNFCCDATAGTTVVAATTTGAAAFISFVVPPGFLYKLTGTATIFKWTEVQ
jgi:hypothetical protein